MVNDNKKGFFARRFGKSQDDIVSTQTYAASPLVLPPPRSNTTDVTVDSALGIATVYRSVNIISTGVSQLSLDTFRGTDKIPNPLVISQPDNDRSLASFLKRTATCLATYGNAYWLISKNPAGVVNNVEVLNPLAVHIQYSDTGVKSYTYGDKTYRDSQIKHLRHTEVPGHIYGLGPIQAYASGLAGALTLRRYSDNWLTDSGIPTGLLTTDLELDAEQAAEARKQWHENTKDGGIQVTGRGLEFKPLALTAADMQFIESLNLSDIQVARIFGVPSAYLEISTEGSNLTYSNRQDLDTQFVRWSLMQYLIEIEDALSSVLPRGQFVKFNVDDFLRAYVDNTSNTTTGASNDLAA